MPHPIETPALNLLASLKRPLKWAIVAGLFSAGFTILSPNYYRSETRLLPVEAKGVGGNLGGLVSTAAALGVSVPGGDGSDANFVDIVNSRWLREQLLNTEFHYHIPSWRFGAEKAEHKTLYGYLAAGNMDQALQGVGSVLSTSRDLKSKVISISAETTSPELSQLIVKEATKLLETFNREKGRTRGGAKATFAEARLADARREMDDAENTLRRFLEVNRNFHSSGDPSVQLKGVRLETELRLRQQLVSAIAMNREQALLEEKNDIPILNILDYANLPIDKSRPARKQIVLAFFFASGFIAWVFGNHKWIINRLLDGQQIVKGENP